LVKRTPPLAVAVIGTGETPTKNVEALLNDYTTPYADVAFILPVDDEHWSSTLADVHAWAVENDIPYVAVTDGSTPSKALVPILEGADSTQKVARVSTKVVQLLAQEAGDGADVALLVAWDDDDQEAATAVTKALSSSVTALNLCDGLDPFEFDDEDGDDEAKETAELKAAESSRESEPTDDYDSKGIRALRALLREHPNKGDLTDRKIGQLEKDAAIELLRELDAGDAPSAAPVPDAEPQEETRTTKARRAFAEGVAEASGDEAQALPRSRGADILENEGDDPIVATQIVDKGIGVAAPGPANEEYLRQRALELAVQSGAGPEGVIPLALKMEVYLRGERQSSGRPRADGTPAQPREIGENGKPIRRRPSRGSTD
jgi:hypothetical protein